MQSPEDLTRLADRLPDGQIRWRLAIGKVHLSRQKYSAFGTAKISSTSLAIPPHQRGVSRSSRTLARDAMDAGVVGGRTAGPRTAKSCGPDASTLAPSLRLISADDGDKKARSPGRARRKPLKPIARGKPDEPDEPVVTWFVCFFICTRSCGRIQRPVFPAPSDLSRATLLSDPGVLRRGNECAYSRGLFRRAIPDRGLASAAHKNKGALPS